MPAWVFSGQESSHLFQCLLEMFWVFIGGFLKSEIYKNVTLVYAYQLANGNIGGIIIYFA